MSEFGVSTGREKALKMRMQALGIVEADIIESFISSSGPGGQNVNKVASCVVLHHLPTNTIVRCQKERSQALNRYQARYLLVTKIVEERQKARLRRQHEVQKLKRKNRPRPPKLKEAILQNKRAKAQKKLARHKISFHRLKEE